jgi:hypothetical protein
MRSRSTFARSVIARVRSVIGRRPVNALRYPLQV